MQKPLYSFLLFLFALLVAGCGKSTDTPESADTWVVTKFTDLATTPGQANPDDDTYRFNGYAFEFDNGDLLTIQVPGGTTAQAKWRLINNDTQMAIGMDTPPALLDEIVGTWNVEEYSATKIRLVNPTPGISVDASKQAVRIEFEKN